MEQIINIQELKKLLPGQAQVQFQRKKGQTNTWFLEIEVIIKPPISLIEHEALVKKIINHFGEDLIEVFTEETGHWFYVYVDMSQTQPTTITL